MNSLITIILACGIVLVAVGLLGISWLLTGKSSLQPGACGRDPTKKRRDDECGACQLCEHEEKDNDCPVDPLKSAPEDAKKHETKDLHD